MMTKTDLQFILSTHENGKPKKRFLRTIITEYFPVAFFLIAFGIYMLYTSKDNNSDYIGFLVFDFIGYMLILFGVLLLILGIKKLRQPETIKVDDYGITIVRGNKEKIAPWNEVVEIKKTFSLHSLPDGTNMSAVPYIEIKTHGWKHKTKSKNFTEYELNQLFINLKERTKNTDIIIMGG
jgi:hypothetical protein